MMSDESEEPEMTTAAQREATRIRRRREELGVSRRTLARLAGVPEYRVWVAEHPERPVVVNRRELAVQLMEALDVVAEEGLPVDLVPVSRREALTRLHKVVRLVNEALDARSRSRSNEFLRVALDVAAYGERTS